jgi:AraC-like DNA-binding protein
LKALTFKIPALTNASIRIDREKLVNFYPHFHTHEEIQFIWIVKGMGTAFIGDKIMPFTEGDLYLISSNLPHVFKSDSSTELVESLSLYFNQRMILSSYDKLPEFDKIRSFMNSFKQGIIINDKKSVQMKKYLNSIENSVGIQRILKLIELLEHIADQSNGETIASPDYSTPKTIDGEKINGIIEYLYSNYAKDIKLSDVADIAHMTPQSFCRYFKRHTRKSMIQYLNQIRIGKACRWLQEKKYTVTESCYQAGFNNISNFNRQFKMITGFTPSSYITKQKTLTK